MNTERNPIPSYSKQGWKEVWKECLMSLKDYPKAILPISGIQKYGKEKEQILYGAGRKKANDRGRDPVCLRYKKAWRFRKRLRPRPFGYMWECPDLFKSEEKILSVCPQGAAPGEDSAFRTSTNLDIFCWRTGKECEQKEFQEWDMGFDFYAPQTFLDSRGRRILMAWAGLPDLEGHYHNPTVEMGWQHSLSFPRELSVQGKRVLQWPVQEIESIRRASVRIEAEQEIPIESAVSTGR